MKRWCKTLCSGFQVVRLHLWIVAPPSTQVWLHHCLLHHFKNGSINISNMIMQKQTRAADCAIYAIATVTYLLLGHDPTSVVFSQKEISETANTLSLFPVVKKRCQHKELSKHSSVLFFTCRLPDSGEEMVMCDKYQEWFHLARFNITETPNTDK